MYTYLYSRMLTCIYLFLHVACKRMIIEEDTSAVAVQIL